MNHTQIAKYIGWEWNIMTKNTIENEFKLYKVEMCDLDDFYTEVFLVNTIRCLVTNNIITNIQFN